MGQVIIAIDLLHYSLVLKKTAKLALFFLFRLYC